MSDKPLTAAEHAIMAGSPPPPEKRVTLDNWDRPPFNRWSFQHVREVLPTAEVKCAEAPPSALGQAQQDFDALRVDHPRNGSSRSVLDVLDASYTDGFIVIHKGDVVYERYFNAMTRSTLHLSQSVAKSVTATACSILIERGEIDVNVPLGDVIPELAGSGYADAKLAQVLDMRSGVKFNEDYTDADSDVALIDYACGWKPMRVGKPEVVFDIPPTLLKETDHGGPFNYRSIETDVMAWVMERATGLRLPQIVSRELWQPLGAEFDACYTVDRAGYALADGGFNAALRDYARVGLLYLNGGQVNGQQLMPAEWVRATFEDGDTEAFKQCPYADAFPRGAYKNQFWVRNVDKRQIMALGVFGQTIYVDPGSDLVAVKLSTWPDFRNTEFMLDAIDAFDAIAAELNAT